MSPEKNEGASYPSASRGRDARPVLALDVGGTKLAAAVVDGDGRLLSRAAGPTPFGPTPSGPIPVGTEGGDGAAEAVLDALLGLARRVMGEAPGPLAATGVGCGGPMSPGGERVSPLHIPAWRDFPLRARLAAALGTAVFVDNDAKALTRAEAWIGAAAGRSDVLGMVVSTGVGGGLLVGGRMLEGAGGNAGHVGHVIVEPDGLRCACGARGCLEAYAAGPAIGRWSGRPPEEATPEVVERVGTLVGRAVASVVNLLDVRLAVVAGSVALGFGTPFFTAAQAELDRRSRLWSGGPTAGGRTAGGRTAGGRPASVGQAARLHVAAGGQAPPRIRPAALGADGPLVGAAAVAFAGLGDR